MKTTLKPALKLNYFYIFIHSKIVIEMESKQLQQFKIVFEVFRGYKEKIAAFLFGTVLINQAGWIISRLGALKIIHYCLTKTCGPKKLIGK